MILGGEVRPATTFIDVRSPYSGELVGRVPSDTKQEALDAVAALSDGALGLHPDDRARVLRAASEELARRADEFTLLIAREAGVCRREAAGEVRRACANLAVAAEEAIRVDGESMLVGDRLNPKLAWTIREPVGLVCAITPFNRPLNQVVVKLAPAFAAGNRVVLKPSEKTPLTALAFAQLLFGVGLPPDALAVVTGEPQLVGHALVSAPEIDMVTFTGSVETGRSVARAAAGKRLLLELGGNDPLVVLDDNDLPHAATLAADGAFATAGQSCRGVKRVIVLEDFATPFVELLAQRAGTKRWGDPLDPETDVGPLIDADAAAVVARRCEQAIADGADVVVGNKFEGALVSPTVLDHVPADTELVVRETFGPVAPVIRVRDEAEAVAVANSTDYGLQSGVVTTDFEQFLRVAHGLRVGAVNFMESPSFDAPRIPFGGVKRSGVGREGIPHAVREMTTIKTITVPRPWQ